MCDPTHIHWRVCITNGCLIKTTTYFCLPHIATAKGSTDLLFKMRAHHVSNAIVIDIINSQYIDNKLYHACMPLVHIASIQPVSSCFTHNPNCFLVISTAKIKSSSSTVRLYARNSKLEATTTTTKCWIEKDERKPLILQSVKALFIRSPLPFLSSAASFFFPQLHNCSSFTPKYFHVLDFKF